MLASQRLFWPPLINLSFLSPTLAMAKDLASKLSMQLKRAHLALAVA
jgi:hypothetical protein